MSMQQVEAGFAQVAAGLPKMNKLSTGQDATLGNYRALASVAFGNDSGATKFLDDKIAESPNGRDEEVIADERQMIYLLAQMHKERGAICHRKL